MAFSFLLAFCQYLYFIFIKETKKIRICYLAVANLTKMGNESSKQGKSSASLKTPFSLKSGPSSTVVQRHLENARKTRVLQLKETGLKVIPTALEEVC